MWYVPTMVSFWAIALSATPSGATVTVFNFAMDGDQTFVVTEGKGCCSVTLDDVTGDVVLECAYQNLTGEPDAAHIHKGAAGQFGDIVLRLTVSGGRGGTITGTGTLDAQDMLNELYYVNLRTDAYPLAEIRGQIVQDAPCKPDGMPILVDTAPVCDGTLTRLSNNVIRLTFDGAVTLPAGIEVFELDAAGSTVGVDQSGNFLYSLESGNTVLRMEENGAVLNNPTWYTLRNTGGWSGVSNFTVVYNAMPGNANADGFTDFGDLSAIFPNFTFAPADDDPFNINADGFVDKADLSASFAFYGAAKPDRPPGNACTIP